VADDPYATGLADDLAHAYSDLGGERVTRVLYSPASPLFDRQLDEVKAARPDGILIIGFRETRRILNQMVQRHMGPTDTRVYGVDANTNNTVGDNYEAGS